MSFALPRLGRLVRDLSFGEPSMGRCLGCGADVHPDERWVRLHGLLFHAACTRVRRPAILLSQAASDLRLQLLDRRSRSFARPAAPLHGHEIVDGCDEHVDCPEIHTGGAPAKGRRTRAAPGGRLRGGRAHPADVAQRQQLDPSQRLGVRDEGHVLADSLELRVEVHQHLSEGLQVGGVVAKQMSRSKVMRAAPQSTAAMPADDHEVDSTSGEAAEHFLRVQLGARAHRRALPRRSLIAAWEA